MRESGCQANYFHSDGVTLRGKIACPVPVGYIRKVTVPARITIECFSCMVQRVTSDTKQDKMLKFRITDLVQNEICGVAVNSTKCIKCLTLRAVSKYRLRTVTYLEVETGTSLPAFHP